jgi:hypothetical protein
MDNRLNKLRKEMSVLRAGMLRAEDAIRDPVNRDQDCTVSALCLMDMRAKMSALIREWTVLGGSVHLPTVEERLKERRGPRSERTTQALTAPSAAASRSGNVLPAAHEGRRPRPSLRANGSAQSAAR